MVVEPSLGCDILAQHPQWDALDGQRYVLAGFGRSDVPIKSASNSVSMSFTFNVTPDVHARVVAWADEQSLSVTKAYRQLFARGHFYLDLQRGRA